MKVMAINKETGQSYELTLTLLAFYFRFPIWLAKGPY